MPNGLVNCKSCVEFGFVVLKGNHILICLLGTDDKAFGFGGTGKKSHAGQFEDYGESFTLNDIIGCFIDLTGGTVHFSKNGKEFGTAFNIPTKLQNNAFFPAILLKVND